jgi:hypothetical protein
MDDHTKATFTALHAWLCEMMLAVDPEYNSGLAQGQSLTNEQSRVRGHLMKAQDALKVFEFHVNSAPRTHG